MRRWGVVAALVACVSAPRPRPGTPTRERLACLAPPWVPAQGGLPTGWTLRAVSRSTFLLTRGEGEALSHDAYVALQERVFAGLTREPGFSHGGTSALRLVTRDESVPALGLSLSMDLCSIRLDEVARRVEDAIEAGAPGVGHRVDVLMEYSGALGPRCDADDPGCTAQPAGGGSDGPLPGAGRELVLPRLGHGRCSHDGECSIGGCGNVCQSWREPQRATNCLGYSELDEGAFCGCVEGRCAFFQQ